ncbi:MAG TPA: hypothetical protein VFO55_09980 [Gemmatimonadaceae bacterium]|nr:hypothetical protein [Gemmatimonadaceae bacterium]
MSTRGFALVALLVIVPATLEAQRRAGRGFDAAGAREADAMIRDLADAPSLSKDLQKANPVEIILDGKKDLHLTDAEQKELKTLNSALKDSIKPYIKTLDSVSRVQTKRGGEPPTSGQMLVMRTVSREAADSVRAKYQWATREAMGKLAEERRQPATDLLSKEMEEQMASRRNARGGRPPA